MSSLVVQNYKNSYNIFNFRRSLKILFKSSKEMLRYKFVDFNLKGISAFNQELRICLHKLLDDPRTSRHYKY